MEVKKPSGVQPVHDSVNLKGLSRKVRFWKMWRNLLGSFYLLWTAHLWVYQAQSGKIAVGLCWCISMWAPNQRLCSAHRPYGFSFSRSPFRLWDTHWGNGRIIALSGEHVETHFRRCKRWMMSWKPDILGTSACHRVGLGNVSFWLRIIWINLKPLSISAVHAMQSDSSWRLDQ